MNDARLRKIAGTHAERRRAKVWTEWRSRLFANGWPEGAQTFRVALHTAAPPPREVSGGAYARTCEALAWTQAVAIWPDTPTKSDVLDEPDDL